MTKIINQITKITVFTIGILSLLGAASPAYAQSAGNQCVIIYGIEFCREATPFVTPFGVIEDSTMIVVVAVFFLAFIAVLNAAFIRSRLFGKEASQ